MKAAEIPPRHLLYEFHREHDIWFPSFAELHDGRLVTENNVLIAFEQLPTGLSIGLMRPTDMPLIVDPSDET